MDDGNTDVVAAAPEPEAPKFVGGAARFKSVTLAWPLAYDGAIYDHVNLHRLTAKEVADWVESIKEKDSVRFPIYRDDSGASIPDVVLDALDDDDRLALDEAAKDFLPRRFQDVESDGSGPAAGGTIAP
ncbi:hypothetical protein [Methylosinus sp. PW1]|uniref:hypothetical protein n=1 Tax=Methylosinus sp. PW1 TaxID=107636 RepID=UPI0006911345|nr:hypothetical protein [Methylosinus sp. PW1]